MRQIGHVENPRWRILRIAIFLGVVATAVAISLAALHTTSASTAGSILSTNQQLSTSQYLRSSNGQYTLYMQTDGNLVVYGNGCAVWGSGTNGTGNNNHLAMQNDGNLVIYTSTSKPVWGSGTNGTGNNNYLAMQNDGNLVVYTSAGKPVWASGTSKADRLCAPATMSTSQYLRSSNGQYTLYMQSDGNLVIYTSAGKPIWGSGTNGTGNNNYLAMQNDGNLVIYTSAGKPVWGSSTNGTGNNNYLTMQDDGNLVVYTSAGKPVWASNTPMATTTGSESAAISWAEGQMVHNLSGYYLQCLKFVFDAYEISSNRHINLHAMISPQPASWSNTYPVQIWGHFNHGVTGTGTNPPPGAIVFWKASNGSVSGSHAALSIGGGYVITTAYNGNSDIHKASMSQFPGAVELGWWLPA